MVRAYILFKESMTQYLLLKRYTSDKIQNYVGPIGEAVINTTDWTLHIQDGKTPGGHVASTLVVAPTGNIGFVPVKSYTNFGPPLQWQAPDNFNDERNLWFR
jgi:hypothetical protein